MVLFSFLWGVFFFTGEAQSFFPAICVSFYAFSLSGSLLNLLARCHVCAGQPKVINNEDHRNGVALLQEFFC